MKKGFTSMMGIVACLFLGSCESSEAVETYFDVELTEEFLNLEKEVHQYPDIGDEDIFDFSFINGAPEAEDTYKTDEIIKIYATTWTIDELDNPIAINLEKSEIYVEPSFDMYGMTFTSDVKKVDDIHEVFALVDKYDVLNWQRYYSNVKDYHSYEDGVSWKIVVQYTDGTIDKFRGEGTIFSEIIPEDYFDFMNELAEYVSRHFD